MKKVYTFLTTIALLTFCFIGRSAADRLLQQHPVTRTNDASESGTRKGEIQTSVEKAIHDVSESQAKSTVSSSVSIKCNVSGSFVGVAQIKGTADTGASGFLADSYDEIATSGIPVTLTTDDLDKYQGKSGNANKTAYVLRLSGVNSSLLFTGIKRHGVFLETGARLGPIQLFPNVSQDLNFSGNASTVKQKNVGMTDAEIIAMFSPYASANGSSLTDGGASNEAHVPSVSADTSMGKDSRSDEDDDSEGDDDTGSTDGGTITYACNVHSGASSDANDHTLQASCSTTNSRGQRCTVTNFYACQSHTHIYPTRIMPCPRTLLYGFRMGGAGIGGVNRRDTSVCSKGGYLTMGDNHRSTCRLRHQYWDCDPASVELHKARTCARCSNNYQNCEGASNPCISGLGHAETVETPVEAPSTPQPSPSPPSETPPEESDTTENEEQETEEEDTTEVPEETAPARPTAVCGSGHTYFTNVSYARHRHRDRTCLRCSQTYQNCSNHGTACQNRHWHTQDDTSYMRGACGHNHRINEKSQHASVTCTTTNANGDRCNGGSYYACQSHTHTYPSRTTPTPPPSPPENSNPNDNENEEEEEEEEEVPAAPPAPTLSYHPCGQHLTTVSGNHSLQASCSRDSNCIASSFYWCQHSSHTYPAPTPTPAPPPPTTVTCGAASWTGCTTDVSSSTEHQVSCSGGHSYWTCGTATAWHQDRTCTRCSQTYQNCSNSATACQSSKWHTETPQVVLVACGAASWTGCTSQLPSSTEHQVSCSGGHSYWTCGTAVAWHKDRTCSRCSQTYQNCGNSATACQGSRWHTE